MTAYFVDLGFDWNADAMQNMQGHPILGSGGQPLYELQWGLVDMTGSTSDASMSNFQNGDQITLNIYDVTALDGNRTGNSGAQPALPNPWIQCVAGDTGTTTQDGFSNPGLNPMAIGDQETGTSTYFGPPAGNVWPIMVPGGGPLVLQVQYPANFTDDATFQLTWEITASLNGVTRTYIVDPEMIVKPTGGGGG